MENKKLKIKTAVVDADKDIKVIDSGELTIDKEVQEKETKIQEQDDLIV